MITRQEKILSCIDLGTQLGIEIGPLNRPIVTREMGNIRYVDHASTEDLKQKYAADSNVDVGAIVDVDYVWGEKTLPELVADEAPFDYVIASHVIEHVPNFIGWLKEIHAVLKPGGILSLVIPDKRYCFDYYRQPTQPPEVIDAYLRGQKKPGPHQVFDFFSLVAFWKGQLAWGENSEFNEADVVRLHSATTAWEMTQQIFASDNYYDVHCWVFTPDSFFSLIKTLISIDLFHFKVARFYQTEGCEFYVTLEAMDLTKDESVRHQIQLESLSSFASENLESHEELARLREHSQQMQHKLKNLRMDKQRLRKKVQNLQADLDIHRDEIAAMQSSKFWKLRARWMQLKQGFGLKE